jgi:phosphate starvation-inducible membrane PsiE
VVDDKGLHLRDNNNEIYSPDGILDVRPFDYFKTLALVREYIQNMFMMNILIIMTITITAVTILMRFGPIFDNKPLLKNISCYRKALSKVNMMDLYEFAT